MIKKTFIETEDYYLEEGFVIMTEAYLKRRGYCCGNKCRHCCYEPIHHKGNINLREDLKKEENEKL